MNKSKNDISEKISESIILDKTMEFLTRLIKGDDIVTLLNANIDFYLDLSGADIITIYLNDDDMVQPEYIFEKDNIFDNLLKKYMLNKAKFTWEKFITNFNNYFSTTLEYNITTSLDEIFKGVLSKTEADSFADELHMKKIIFIPLYAIDENVKIGYVNFIFQSDKDVDIVKIQETALMFQVVLRPLYDSESNTIYTKCIRVDGEMKILTEQERKIVEKVFGGFTYVEIAKSLDVSINTIKTHMKNIFNKCNVNSKIELFHKFSIYQ